jgi:hypothetical protein
MMKGGFRLIHDDEFIEHDFDFASREVGVGHVFFATVP